MKRRVWIALVPNISYRLIPVEFYAGVSEAVALDTAKQEWGECVVVEGVLEWSQPKRLRRAFLRASSSPSGSPDAG